MEKNCTVENGMGNSQERNGSRERWSIKKEEVETGGKNQRKEKAVVTPGVFEEVKRDERLNKYACPPLTVCKFVEALPQKPFDSKQL